MAVSSRDSMKRQRKKLRKNCFFLGKSFGAGVFLAGHVRETARSAAKLLAVTGNMASGLSGIDGAESAV
ncbi:hypothetical protein AGR5A_Cc190092 [Agrobacterium genomosp. 5 str. CFBP 6626]|nr:hypothetical protein AGR5A_Cc190092 [Agrobacterium genomosp. 5 str. CFBP 6626]